MVDKKNGEEEDRISGKLIFLNIDVFDKFSLCAGLKNYLFVWG